MLQKICGQQEQMAIAKEVQNIEIQIKLNEYLLNLR